jgi:N,N'-diacetyllegionaminate synthase
MRIGEREIGVDHRPYIIAEIGVNHDGEVERALSLTDAAADAGADAVKLQFFETDRLMSKAAKLAAYQKNAGETDPIEMLRRLELTIDEMALVVDRAHQRGIHAIVTVFSTELVEIAETLAWDAYKSASPDIVNRPLLEALMLTGRPMIVSTGASELDEVLQAVDWLDEAVNRLAVLHCVSCYPTSLEDAALGGCDALMEVLSCPVGYSDHTATHHPGPLLSPLKVCIFEKHFTYDPDAAGPDHAASLNPEQLAEYIRYTQGAYFDDASVSVLGSIRLKAPFSTYFGSIEKRVLDCERDVRMVARQSVVSTRPIALGETITPEMLTIKRPGTGILAYEMDTVVGQRASRAIEADVPIVREDLS